jgi:beta-phosphoglucomutase-like phosphatase (HAD superfamily)
MGESFKNAELKKICEDLGVKPEQIIFFDDSNPNITHACDMGVNAFTTAPFTRDHEVHIAAHLGLDSLGTLFSMYHGFCHQTLNPAILLDGS